VVLGVDGGTAHQRQVDDQGIVGNAEAGRVMAAATDRDLDVVLAGELHARDHVGRVPAARYGGGVLVDHGVVDRSGRVVVAISRHDQVTAQYGR
jgi:hypothetical protein